MTPSTQALAADGRSLERLRLDASRDPQAAVKQAAGQFEALFTQMVLKSMRDALPKGELTDSSAADTWTGMLDQQLAQSVGGRPGGLADLIAKQLSRNMKGGDAPQVDDGQLSDALRMGADRIAPRQAGMAAASPAARRADAAATEEATAAAAAKASRLPPDRAAFVQKLWEPAQAASRATGIPANFIIGQAALETGWGRGEIRSTDGRPSHNLFGVKAGANWKGPTVDAVTTEYVNGRAVKKTERFRAYASYEESVRDWANLIGNSPRYAQVVRAGGTVEGFAQGLQRAGYATDPRYADKLAKTINTALALRRLTV